MDQPFIAQIMMWAGTFAPRGWAECHGQLMSISSNTAMFSLVGTNYGGDGRTTFGLPDMRSRMPVGDGRGTGLSLRQLGQKGGEETVTLNVTEMPSHSHSASVGPTGSAVNATNSTANTTDPADAYLAKAVTQSGEAIAVYHSGTPSSPVNLGGSTVSIGNNGGNQGHKNMPPFEVVKFVISLQGLYPSRN